MLYQKLQLHLFTTSFCSLVLYTFEGATRTQTQTMALTITILGAGIAGLTTAVALQRQNPEHRITILEKSTRNEEFGAALHLGPNCSGFLAELGLKLEENAGATRVLGMRQVRGESGEEKMKLDLGETCLGVCYCEKELAWS